MELHPTKRDRTRSGNTSDTTSLADLLETLPHETQLNITRDVLLPMIGPESAASVRRVVERTAKSLRFVARLDSQACRSEFASLIRTLRCNDPPLEDEPADMGEAEKRAETMEEIAESLKSWLLRVWDTCCVHGIDLDQGLDVLLTLFDSYSVLVNPPAKCICDFNAYTIDFHFRGRDGKNAKSWHHEGGPFFGEVIYWTIREVLLTRLRESRAEVERLPTYFRQLNDTGISLSTMIKGGSNKLHIEPDTDFVDDEVWISANEVPNPCIDYPLHWTLKTHTHMNLLLKNVVNYLMEQFKGDPSYAKFKVIHELDPDYQESMHQCLRSDMIHSRNAANCALRVFLAYHLFGDVAKVIRNAGHLFQPRDYLILQAAAKNLGGRRNSHAVALNLVESQLVDVLECIQAAIVEIWKGGDNGKKAKMLLDEILALPLNDPIRAAKVSEWKEIAFTLAHVGPSEVFAAMYGFDREDDEEDDDPLLPGGSGTCPNAGEYSPSGSAGEVDRKLLSKRWCAWMNVGSRLPRGNPSLVSVYNRVEKRMYEMFPWMRLGDARNHVILRLRTSGRDNQVYLGVLCMIRFSGEQVKERRRIKRLQGGDEKVPLSTPTLKE